MHFVVFAYFFNTACITVLVHCTVTVCKKNTFFKCGQTFDKNIDIYCKLACRKSETEGHRQADRQTDKQIQTNIQTDTSK